MHSSFSIPGFHQIAQSFANGLNHDRTTFHVKRAHAANVAGEVALSNKISQGSLLDEGRTPIRNPTCCQKGIDQVLGNNQVAESKRRKEHLAKSAYIDDSAISIQALERWNRLTLVAVLAVKVILDNPGIILCDPVEQLQAVRQAENHAQRKLVRRGDINQLRGHMLLREQFDT